MTTPRIIPTIGIAVLAAWLIYAMWPGAYEQYVSPPLDGLGRRVELLVPQGWLKEVRVSMQTPALQVEIVPPDRPSWWPAILRRWFPAPNQFRNRIAVMILTGGEALSLKNDERASGGKSTTNGITSWFGTKSLSIRQGEFTAAVMYSRDDREAFEGTRDTILNSLQLRLKH